MFLLYIFDYAEYAFFKISESFNKRRPKCVYCYCFCFRTLSAILWKSNKSKLVLLVIYQSKYLLGSLKNQEHRQISNYETLFPDFYYSSSQNGWFCKICPNFYPGSGFQPFIKKAGWFDDHPSQRVELHLGSERHQKAVQNMQFLQSMQVLQNRHTSVHNILVEANLASEIKKTNNRFMLKVIFQILHFLALKNWAYTHRFKEGMNFAIICFLDPRIQSFCLLSVFPNSLK